MKVTVRVPATTANLGAGFDCFGLALGLFNEVTVATGGPPGINLVGEGQGVFPRDSRNLVYRTIGRYFAHIGQPTPDLALHLSNQIPPSGGLGSSAAAVVGGLVAANELCGGLLSQEDLLNLACAIEGHPDNVAPALLGGLVLSVLEGDRVITLKVPAPPGLRAVLFVPDFVMPTAEARRILPDTVPRSDAVYNLSRSALFVAALAAGRLDLLAVAMQDRLHQPHREALFPAMPRFFAAARQAGALGACLSGAGSAILALTAGAEEAVAQAWQQEAQAAGLTSRTFVVDLWEAGATVVGRQQKPCPSAAQGLNL